ncbi:50S ribosomal protein L24 [Chlamydiales bacterium STE3]|nr:50S ribosomal protein L24 [Chlamydiales bacterium STE3]
MDKKQKKQPKRIRKDDTVVVIAGNSRGQTGKVLKTSGDKVYVQGVNLGKKHVKATRTSKGAILEIERPIHVSNLKVMVGEKAVKLKTRVNEEGVKELYYKAGEENIAYRTLNRS